MNNYKNFLFERTERIEIISEDKVIELLSKYSKNELSDIFSGSCFYRGDAVNTNFALCRPKLNKRVSPHAENNYYNIFLSNDETWKEYPSREYSIIGSTTLDKSRTYGNSYLCIPLNKQANIGIAPKSDIWVSFKTLDELYFPSLNRFFSVIAQFMVSTQFIVNYDALKKELENPEFLTDIKKSELGYHSFEKHLKKSKNAFKTIQELLDPEKNNFKHLPFEKFILGTFKNNEVWTSDDVIMIDVFKIKDIKSKLGI